MRHVLDPRLDALAPLASPTALIGFDFDGTLAPIVTDRDAAALRPATRELLVQVCGRARCAVVSGRARADVLARLDGVPVHHVIGNHGGEVGGGEAHAGTEGAPAIAAQLRRALADLAGVEIEDKQLSVAVHYRRADRPAEVRPRIAAAIAALTQPVRAIEGARVVDVIPRGAPHKGNAIVALRAETGADAVLYVGDDTTDEDVFALAAPWLIGVRVGPSTRSAARYFVRDQTEVDRLLAAILELLGRGRRS